jgi:hypothetical protein
MDLRYVEEQYFNAKEKNIYADNTLVALVNEPRKFQHQFILNE